MQGDPFSLFTCLSFRLTSPETERSQCIFWLTNTFKKGVLYLTEIVTPCTEQDTPKKLLQQAPAFPRVWLCTYYIQDNIFIRDCSCLQRSVWGNPRALFHGAQPLGPHDSSQPPHRLCNCKSSHLQIKPGSPPRAPQLDLPSSSPLKEDFLCRGKVFLTGLLRLDPRVILVSICPRSHCLHLAPPSLLRWRPVALCHKRGGDLSMQWLSLAQGHPREEGGWCQIKTQFKRQESSFPVTLHKLGFREAIAVIAGCLAQPAYWAKSSIQVSIQTSGLSFFWSPLMMQTAKTEPQVQGCEFSLGGCLAVRWVSLPEAPRQLGTSQAVSFCSDCNWHGLYESSPTALKSGKPKGDNDFMTATARFPTLSVFILTNHCMSPILMIHPV